MERAFRARATIVPLAGNAAQETPVDRLFRQYLISIVPFCLPCAMIARRAGRSHANGLWGVAAAFGVFVVTVNALQDSGAPRR